MRNDYLVNPLSEKLGIFAVRWREVKGLFKELVESEKILRSMRERV
jgi:hypothetical protein